MVRHCGTVLVDMNVIVEAHRTGSWRALTGGYAVETVKDCVTETRAGFQRRQPEQHLPPLPIMLRSRDRQALSRSHRSRPNCP